jgi:hypothetical protein
VPSILGVGLWTFFMPNFPGTVFHNQAVILAPAANSLGLTVSNGGRGMIGS